MKKLAISVGTGLAGAVAIAAAIVGLRHYGIQISEPLLTAAAALLAFSASLAVLVQNELNKPKPKTKPDETLSQPISQLDDKYISKFPSKNGPDSARFLIEYNTDAEILKSHKNLDSASDVMLTFKKPSSAKSLFNPLKIKQIVAAVKDKPGFKHILLMDEQDHFIGYIPGAWARAKADDCAGKMLSVLDKPETSVDLRQIGGLAAPDIISDDQKVSAALVRMGTGLLHGLVVLHGARQKKPIGIIWANDLYPMALPKR